MLTSLWQTKRFYLILGMTFIVFPLLLIFTLTRSFSLSFFAENFLSKHLNQHVHVHSASWDWSGKLVLNRVVLNSSKMDGPAAEILSISSLDIGFKSRVPIFNQSINELVIGDITVRIAESLDSPGVFNFSNFEDEMPIRGAQSFGQLATEPIKSLQIPSLELSKITIESGVVKGSEWELETSKIFVVQKNEDNQEGISIQLNEVDGLLPLSVFFNKKDYSVSMEIAKLNLNDSVFSLFPPTTREWCEEINLSGDISQLILSWTNLNGFQMAGNVSNLHFLLPEEHSFSWTRYNEGEMHRIRGDTPLDVESGTFKYSDDSFEFIDIYGQLYSPAQSNEVQQIRFNASVEINEFNLIHSVRKPDWLNVILNHSLLFAKFSINGFKSNETEKGEVDLPLAAAHMLKIFQLKGWEVNSEIEMHRSQPKEELQVNGNMRIKGESGIYEKFPYPLTEVNSIISFHQDKIKIQSLVAKGSNDSRVSIIGEVDISNELIVDLELFVREAPLDVHLKKAVSPQIEAVMSNLLDYDALRELQEKHPGGQYDSFELGGVIDMDLHLFHDSSQSSDVEILGEVLFQDIGILQSSFPFPIKVKSGRVKLDPSGIWIPEDSQIHFEGPGKGLGIILGKIEFQTNGPAVPLIELSLKNEKVTSELIESIAISAGDSYATAHGLLTGLGLDARLSMNGFFNGNTEGDLSTNFTVFIEDGIAKPNALFAKSIHSSEAFWPEEFQFTNIDAKVIIQDNRIEMHDATGLCEGGSVEVSLVIDNESLDFILRGVNLPLSNQFINVLPNSASNKLATAWHWLNPSGGIDVDMRVQHREGKPTLHMAIAPQIISIANGNEVVDLRRIRGSVVVENANVFLNNLDFQLHQEQNPHGILQMEGEVYGSSDVFQFAVNMDWKAANLSSPLVRSIVGMIGEEEAVTYFDSIGPEGTAFARLAAEGNGNSLKYQFVVEPNVLSASFNNRRANATFNVASEGVSNQIIFDNEGIHFDDLEGVLGNGEFSLNGSINTLRRINGKFDLAWKGPSNDENLFAVLPQVIGDSLEAMQLEQGTSELPDGILSFKGENWKELDIEFAGDVFLSNAAINMGIPLTNIKGRASVFCKYDGMLSELSIELNADELISLGRPLHQVNGHCILSESGNRILFESIRGESNTGAVTVDGWLSTDESKKYEVVVLVDGVPLASELTDDTLATLRGNLSGWISVTGQREALATRVGIGELKISGGHLEVDPLSTTAMSVLNLTIPSASTIEGANILLHIEGNQLILDNIKLVSRDSNISDFVLEGTGSMDIDSFKLHARLHPRMGIPIIRDIAGVLNDQLYAIDITGELLNPNFFIVPLPFLSPP